mmetsp:Transcript_729/g.1925  ORF Transcript_729/g.1925 Transcript_729/m.1925 type:complete len:234 (+) Transcript_729:776-1477(+)
MADRGRLEGAQARGAARLGGPGADRRPVGALQDDPGQQMPALRGVPRDLRPAGRRARRGGRRAHDDGAVQLVVRSLDAAHVAPPALALRQVALHHCGQLRDVPLVCAAARALGPLHVHRGGGQRHLARVCAQIPLRGRAGGILEPGEAQAVLALPLRGARDAAHRERRALRLARVRGRDVRRVPMTGSAAAKSSSRLTIARGGAIGGVRGRRRPARAHGGTGSVPVRPTACAG